MQVFYSKKIHIKRSVSNIQHNYQLMIFLIIPKFLFRHQAVNYDGII